jgi:hypothetical protein
MMKSINLLIAIGAAAAVLSGCGETPQTNVAKAGQSAAKLDDKPFGPDTQFADRAAWERHMRSRADNQNEYKRTN